MAIVRSGQITVAAAGTAIQGTAVAGRTFAFRAHPDNTDTAWIGSDEAASPDVSATTGFPLHTDGNTVVLTVNNLNQLWFDADVNGEKVCWIRLD